MSSAAAIGHLTTAGSVPFESTHKLAVEVAQAAHDVARSARTAAPAFAVRPVPELFSGLYDYGDLPSAPLQLLQDLGAVTAGPLTADAELLAIAGSWAILRYLWAFDAPEAASGHLRSAAVTDEVRYHRRTLFSEDFGIALAARALATHLWGSADPPPLLDADMVLDELVNAGAVAHAGPKRPDYLAWIRDETGDARTLVVVECKGCSSSRATSVGQLAAGARQALSVRAIGVPTRHFVIGAVVERPAPRLYAHAVEVRPTRPALLPGDGAATAVVDRIFQRADDVRLLRLVGAHASAARREGREAAEAAEARQLPMGGASYRGITRLVPGREGVARVRIGLREAVFAEAEAGERRRRADDASASRLLGRSTESAWRLRGSAESLPREYRTGPWAADDESADVHGEWHERRDARPRTDTSVAYEEEGRAVVETVDGVRIDVASASAAAEAPPV